jgi:pyridoxal phosphate enzyme (YggS family)
VLAACRQQFLPCNWSDCPGRSLTPISILNQAPALSFGERPLSSISPRDVIRTNLARVRNRIAEAAIRAGRSPDQIRLVAVTKYASLEAIRHLIALGETQLGENRPQQLISRAALFADTCPSPLAWHLIGQLQRNKVRAVLPSAAMIHSVDSFPLLERISQIARELNLVPQILLQVNISEETSKSGFPAEELRSRWSELGQVPNVELAGLMAMAPLTEDEELIRSTFRGLRELRDGLRSESPGIPLNELSMGMSHDFPIAIEEGATLVRLGSVLFEGLAS